MTTWRTISASSASPRCFTTSCLAAPTTSWKYLRIKNDKLYFAVGAPCNICDPGESAKIFRMNLDGSGLETIASGVRNTVGFDFDPKTGDLWFTDNGRDWFSEELPNDELNHVTQPGKQHFGYPSASRATFPMRNSDGASRATTTPSPPRCLGRTPARWG